LPSDGLLRPIDLARVSVNLYASVRDAAGLSHIEMDVRDVRGLLLGLAERFGGPMQALVDAGARSGELVVLVNGINVHIGMHDAPLSDGDEVSVFPPISGG
jgi:MoaD family protein